MSPAPTRPAPATSHTRSSPSSAEIAARLAGGTQDFRRADGAAVLWQVAERPVGYAEAVAAMERHADAIASGAEPERVWLVEHPPLYTAGSGVVDLPAGTRFPVHRAGRGGQVTYHGPGQRVAYVMLDLSARHRDVRGFVAALERWIVDTLATFSVCGERREDRVGVWVRRPDKARGPGGAPAEDKIAAIGIRLRRWVSFHGIALNVEPDLSHYADIVPCGIAGAHLGQASLVDLGLPVTMAEVDAALRDAFEGVFGAVSG